jgi:hypothetical protein
MQEAMAAADGYRGLFGAIMLYEDIDSELVPVINYSADGSIKAGEAVPDADKFEDDPWTDAEIEHNFRVGAEVAERNARGDFVRPEDLESYSPTARAELRARVEAEIAARSASAD